MAKLSTLEKSINQRVKELYDRLSKLGEVVGAGDFCDKAGLDKSNFSKYFKDDDKQKEVKGEVLVKLTNTFNVNPVWLLTGKGNMQIIEEDEPRVKEYVNRTDSRVEEQEIPLYEHKASAGLTKLFSNSENILDYIHVPNLPKCDGAVHINGDSMYPLLKSGDIVMYKQIHDILNGIFWGEMYLVSLNLDDEDYTLVKYIQRSELGKEYVKLVSQNQYHSPKDVPITSIRALGYIKASIRINSMS